MDYFKEVNLAVTICDKEGKILEMNDKSRKTFLKPGQEDLIGKNVLEYVAAATGILRKEIPPSAATAITRFGYKNAAPITAVTYGLQSNTFPQVNPTMIGMKYMIASPAAYRTR